MLPCRADYVQTILAAVLLASACTLADASGQRNDHPIVPYYERVHSAADGNLATGGRLLLGELNCVACHQAEPTVAGQLLTRQSPILDEVGARVRPEFLRAFLADPQQTKPGTTMPNLFATTSPAERDQQVESLVHFLASTGQLLEAGPITPAVH